MEICLELELLVVGCLGISFAAGLPLVTTEKSLNTTTILGRQTTVTVAA